MAVGEAVSKLRQLSMEHIPAKQERVSTDLYADPVFSSLCVTRFEGASR